MKISFGGVWGLVGRAYTVDAFHSRWKSGISIFGLDKTHENGYFLFLFSTSLSKLTKATKVDH